MSLERRHSLFGHGPQAHLGIDHRTSLSKSKLGVGQVGVPPRQQIKRRKWNWIGLTLLGDPDRVANMRPIGSHKENDNFDNFRFPYL